MQTDNSLINYLYETIIGRAFAVSNALGSGCLEKIHENALVHELRNAGLAVTQQHRIIVLHDGIAIDTYTADLFVENTVLVELKAVKTLDTLHGAQCLNYLKATGLRLCLLLNFGNPRLEIRRLLNAP